MTILAEPMAEQRQAANLHSIATTGFDQHLNYSGYSDHLPPSGNADDSNHYLSTSLLTALPIKHRAQDGPVFTPSPMDDAKLVETGFHFLNGIDTSIPALSGELSFATQLANRNNPTTIENIKQKLTNLPPEWNTFTKEQQEAFCSLVDCAEMKTAIRLELRAKERAIYEQEYRYLSTDYGIGNVVHGWDLSNQAQTSLSDRQLSSISRIAPRRKVREEDRIFSDSSVMSFVSSNRIPTAAAVSKLQTRPEVPKKKRLKEKVLKKKRSARMPVIPDDGSDTVDGSVLDETFSPQESEDEDEEEDDLESASSVRLGQKKISPKKLKQSTLSKSNKNSAGIRPHLQSTSSSGPESGQRLRNLLTNKSSHGSAAAPTTETPETPLAPLKLKISRKVIESSPAPASPAPNVLAPIDSNPPTTSGDGARRNSIRPGKAPPLYQRLKLQEQ